MCAHRAAYLFRIFNCEEMAHDLSVVSSLAGQTLRRIALVANLNVAHHLDFLSWFGYLYQRKRTRRNSAVHELRLRVEPMIEQRFERRDLCFRRDRIGPHPGDFPNIDLTVGNDIGSSGGKMTRYSTAYPINRLADINRNIVEIT